MEKARPTAIEVRRNRFARNDACIIGAPGNRNVIARNRVSRDGDGIAIEKGRGNLVARNFVVGARAGRHLSSGSTSPTPIGGVDNIVRRNEVRGSGDDAFDGQQEGQP